ncbi:AAA family ATPase [Gordonia sp. NPDC003376]
MPTDDVSEAAPTAEQSLVDTVWDLLDADANLDDDTKYLVIAAMDSEESLTAQLGEGALAQHRPEPEAREEHPAGAFVHQISVSGFRGIGAAATLKITPFPGITVVSGRNGSGKSSFAEALEFALTGQSYRWRNKGAKLWQDNWRNLHSPDPCSVSVEFAVEDGTTTSIGAEWAAGAELGDAKHWSQVMREKQQEGVSALGWTNAIEIHRPILSYDEIGGLLDQEPSKLYDALAKLLALDEIQDAEARLDALFKQKSQPGEMAKAALRQIKSQVQESDDPRSAELAKLVRKHPPNLDAVAELISGSTSGAESVVVRLDAIANTAGPDVQHAAALAASLRDALSTSRGLADESMRTAELRADLLRKALEFHSADAEPAACPVCGEGTLTADWAEHTRAFLETEQGQLAMYSEARAQVNQLEQQARALLTSVPMVTVIGGAELTSLSAYQVTQAAAAQIPHTVEGLPSHLESTIPAVQASLDTLRTEATELSAALRDSWAPIATATLAWLGLERDAQQSTELVDRISKARNWVRNHSGELRNERLRPISEGARAIWSQLRQESNVEISDIALEGRRNRRRAVLQGTVDGQETSALSVMSQGELHALALALFLPRATAAASPFRFVVLDDPIQAMDPAKIDGFLNVLTGIAQNRQVIVFSHDDRLPTAIRQRSIPAQLLEVRREQGSQVTVKFADVPARRFVDDARALVSDRTLSDDVRRQVLPGFFRFAIEAAARQAFYTQRSLHGDKQIETEELWHGATTTADYISLVLETTAGTTPSVTSWCKLRSYRGTAVGIATHGFHHGAHISHADVNDLKSTVDDILATR